MKTTRTFALLLAVILVAALFVPLVARADAIPSVILDTYEIYIEDTDQIPTEVRDDGTGYAIYANLRNTTAADITASVLFNSTGAFVLAGTTGLKSVFIPAGGSARVHFFVNYTGTGNKFDITIYNGTEQIQGTAVIRQVVESGGSSGPTGSIPRVIVDNYTGTGSSVAAGSSFNFGFTLRNTSETTAVTNMKITVSSEDGAFTPTSGSNSFYEKSIAVGRTKSYSLPMSVKTDAESKSYAISITIDYEDKNGSPYSTTEKISVRVVQAQKLELRNVFVSEMGNIGMSSPISFEYINTGKATLYNLSMKIDGDFTVEGGEVYIGNFQSGSIDYMETMLTPNSTGSLEGKIILYFEDAAGNPTEVEHAFTMQVQEGMEPDGGGKFPPDGEFPTPVQPAGTPWLLYGGIVAAVVIALVVVLVVVRKKRAKRALEQDDEEI